ncbi:uncharacterized protein LOC116198985 isoform X2 [Punica granatum]|uniref:Uncharacterized protein LOC116198985 isoform X2 n=2 Tax=Punica granatum TaxID=22663 RepID=A0A6P8D0Q7_PUNGR|nr:uncharacterized protein LOC116198985 isoform X2 [Punica granatum]
MVHRMDSCHKVKVKAEGDDAAALELFGPADKRPRLSGDGAPQIDLESLVTEYNPLNEPSPLGLRLKKSPSLLELIQMRLSREQKPKPSSLGAKSQKTSSTDKLKASNFPASLLKIGSWEYKSKYEGDLVGKCYFAKHKLVWEVLDGALKNKIEIQWSDIVAIKANYAVDATDTLEVVLARQPLFFRETNPQPRKHTLWQPTSDFTSGQASVHRRHLLHCPQGLLGRHFEKLIQCDPRLNFLSQQPEKVLESLYFEPKISMFHEHSEPNRRFGLSGEEGSSFFTIPGTATQSGTQSSSSKNESQELLSTGPDNYSSSPSSGTIEEVGSNIPKEQSLLSQWGQVKVPGIHPSMSMSDLVTHLGHCISEQKGFADSLFPGDEQLNRDVLEELTRYLLNDSTIPGTTDEQSLMSRVNSLCNLLQKDAATRADTYVANDRVFTKVWKSDAGVGPSDPGAELSGGPATARAMTRKDSVGELLLNLPRIASLPHILPAVPEDSSNGR